MINKTEFTFILKNISLTDAKKAINKTIKFLYEQEPEFGDINED